MSREDEFVQSLKDPQGENMKYFAIDLLEGKYDVGRLMQAAQRYEAIQQIGYVADVTRAAALQKGMNVQGLIELVHACNTTIQGDAPWCHLSQDLPRWAQELIAEGPQTEFNKTWRVYARLGPSDIADWIDLYVLKPHAPSPRR